MTVTFRYDFDGFFLMKLVEGCLMISVYLMLLLSSRFQDQDRRDLNLLKYAGIIGIIFVGIYTALPTLVCSPPITGLCYTIAFFKGLIYRIPILVSLGILLFLFGNQNQETNGRFLYYSGIFWMVAFMGFFIGLLVLNFGLWMLFSLGIATYFAVPAFAMMIVHGAKFKDNYFILAGVFYILSWLSSIILPLFITF